MLSIVLCMAELGPWELLFWLGVAGSLITGLMYLLKGLNRLTEVKSV